jgi:hypothetical protein
VRKGFGISIYRISENSEREPWRNPHFKYDESELAPPNRQAIMSWKAHADRNNYRMVVIIIPPEAFFNQENRYAEFIRFLNSQHIEHIDLSREFRLRKIPVSDLYWSTDDDAHLSESGNIITGNILASFFRADHASRNLADP